jgi:hypothetical protein
MVFLNGSIEFSMYESYPHSGDILSQRFSANYSLDNGEWKNLTFSSFTSEEFSDPIIGGYWNNLECKYSTVLLGLSEGPHSIMVTVNPYAYRYRYALSQVYFTINTPISITVLSPQNKTYNANSLPLSFTVNHPAFLDSL